MSGAWTGGDVGERARCVLAPNPGPMTLDGTNTWVLHEPAAAVLRRRRPGSGRANRTCGRCSRPLAQVATGSPRSCSPTATLTTPRVPAVRRAGRHRASGRWTPRTVSADEGLSDGDVVAVGGVEVRVLGTPGHTADSLSFLLDAGRRSRCSPGTRSWVAGPRSWRSPTGGSADYLESLDRLAALAEAGRGDAGAARPRPGARRPAAVLAAYARTGASGWSRWPSAMRAGARTASEVVEVVYADVDPALWPAARPASGHSWSTSASPRRTADRVSAPGGPAARGRPGSTERCSSRSQPRFWKSASALFTVSRDAPTSWASSSWVRSWVTTARSRRAGRRRTSWPGRAEPWPPGRGRR